MRYVMMHKTNAYWESGGVPPPEMVKDVGALMGEMAQRGILRGGEGLRASSQGARLKTENGKETLTRGPLVGSHELAAGFSEVHAPTLEDAVAWARAEAAILGDVEMDIRPMTEPWDIGMAPAPAVTPPRRFMVLCKADAASESGLPVEDGVQRRLEAHRSSSAGAARHVHTLALEPSSRGRRYRRTASGLSVTDGPFAETRELLAGYAMVDVPTLEEAMELARRYFHVVGTDEVDVRGVV